MTSLSKPVLAPWSMALAAIHSRRGRRRWCRRGARPHIVPTVWVPWLLSSTGNVVPVPSTSSQHSCHGATRAAPARRERRVVAVDAGVEGADEGAGAVDAEVAPDLEARDRARRRASCRCRAWLPRSRSSEAGRSRTGWIKRDREVAARPRRRPSRAARRSISAGSGLDHDEVADPVAGEADDAAIALAGRRGRSSSGRWDSAASCSAVTMTPWRCWRVARVWSSSAASWATGACSVRWTMTLTGESGGGRRELRGEVGADLPGQRGDCRAAGRPGRARRRELDARGSPSGWVKTRGFARDCSMKR